MKINFRMLWATLGILGFLVFSLIAFELIGFATSTDGGDGYSILHTARLSDLNHASGKMLDIYGLGIAGLVVAFSALALPLVGFFLGKMPKTNAALGGVALFLEVIGAALMITAISLFITASGTLVIDDRKTGSTFINPKDNFSGTLIAADYVLLGLGLGISLGGVASAFFKMSNKSKSK